MAEIASTQTGVFDIGIQNISIVSPNGKATDIQYMVESGVFYENIVTPIVYGQIEVLDGLNLIDKLPITGFDYILVSFKSPGSSKPIKKNFRVFDIKNRIRVSNAAQTYTISFCSEELFLASQYLVSKSYKGKKISDIVKDICDNHLKIPTDRLKIEDTNGTHDLILPYMKPFEAINFIARKGLTKSNHPSYVFYETLLDGFKFISIEGLLKEQEKATYIYEQKHIDYNEINPFSILVYEIQKNFNTISNVQGGKYASNLQTIDLLRQKSILNKFDFSKFFDSTKHLEQSGSNSKMMDSENRKKDAPNEAFDSHSRFVFTNLDQSKSEYIKSKMPDIKNTNVEMTDLQRNSFFQNFADMNIQIVVPGNSTLKCGDIISISLPASEVQYDKSRNKEVTMSGRHMISRLMHTFENRKFSTTLWLVKDDTKDKNFKAQKGNALLDAIKGF